MPRNDIRSATTMTKDRAGVSRQIERIQDMEGSRFYQRGLFDTIRGRRDSRRADWVADGDRAGRDGKEPYPVERLDLGEDFVVAVSGEVLVLAQHRGRALETLEPAGFGRGVPIPELRDRVFRFSKAGASAGTANALARALHARNIVASVNYVVPLGYVAKGEGGFEPTKVVTGYRGPGDSEAPGVPVAVVDTGIADQPRKDGWLTNVARDASSIDRLFHPAPNQLDLAAGHGTFAAGVLQRVSPTAKIVAYAAVGTDGIGSDVDVSLAVLKAAEDGAKIVNLSLGTETDPGVQPVAMRVTLQILAEERPDVLLVAAAGNSGSRRPSWPAAFPEVVAVASLTADLQPSAWSNHGPWVDCSAVGEGVVAPYVEGKESDEVDKGEGGGDLFGPSSWAVGTGTSFAAPQVAGAIAELMPANGGSAHAARDQLLSSGPGVRRRPGYGWCLDILQGTPR